MDVLISIAIAYFHEVLEGAVSTVYTMHLARMQSASPMLKP